MLSVECFNGVPATGNFDRGLIKTWEVCHYFKEETTGFEIANSVLIDMSNLIESQIIFVLLHTALPW